MNLQNHSRSEILSANTGSKRRSGLCRKIRSGCMGFMCMLSLVAAAATGTGKNFDPVSQDPVVLDKAHPPRVHETTFDSGGIPLYAKVFSAQGTTAHPTVLIARGYPDMTSSADIGFALQRAGYNAMIFNYRGTWGMGGSYSMENSYEDLQAAVAFLRSYQTSKTMLVDPNNILLFGYSFGGPIVLRLAAADPKIRGVVHLDGTDLRALPNLKPEEKASWAVGLATTAVPAADGVKIIDDIIAQFGDWNPESYAPGLAGKDVFLIWATRGNGSLVRAAGRSLHDLYAPQARVTEKVFDTTHDFVDHRIDLMRATLAWVGKVRMAPASFTPQSAQDEHKEIKLSAAQLAKYVGTYQAPLGPVYFRLDGDRLMNADAEQQWLHVIALENKKFSVPDDPNADCDDLEFNEDANGKVVAFVVHCQAGTFTMPRVSDEVQLPKENPIVEVAEPVLKQYTGKYKLPLKFQPATYVEISLKGKQLTGKLEGAPESFLLNAESDSKFFVRINKSTAEFVKDEKGAVTHVHVIMDDGEYDFPRQQ